MPHRVGECTCAPGVWVTAWHAVIVGWQQRPRWLSMEWEPLCSRGSGQVQCVCSVCVQRAGATKCVSRAPHPLHASSCFQPGLRQASPEAGTCPSSPPATTSYQPLPHPCWSPLPPTHNAPTLFGGHSGCTPPLGLDPRGRPDCEPCPFTSAKLDPPPQYPDAPQGQPAGARHEVRAPRSPC